MPNKKTILYIAASLPKRSETFVYRELFALRESGIDVKAASVHKPEYHLGNERLDELANHITTVYGSGYLRMITDVFIELVGNFQQSIKTIFLGLKDALTDYDIAFSRRPKVFWQCLGGIALSRRIKKWGIAHIHAHMAHVPTTIAMYCAKQLNITFSFTGHAADLFVQRTMLKKKLTRSAFVACISEWHRSFYGKIAKLGEDRMPIIRCGVDVDYFSRKSRSQNKTIRILTVGRLVRKKGFDVLLESLDRLNSEKYKFECLLVGEGPEKGRLEELCGKLRLKDSVSFVGEKSSQEVRDLMRSSDIIALPCRVDIQGDRDGIPVVLMEGMACELSVIAGDLPAIRELIQNNENGLLVQPDNVSDLTNALRRLIEDADYRDKIGRQGRQKIIAEFSLQKNRDRLIKAFDAVEEKIK